jgi:LuxR family maltose regulon positive regulatory protein
VRCVVTFVLGGVHYLRQELPRAIELMKEASQLGQQAGNVHVAVSALSSAGDLSRQLGQLANAEKAYLQALQLGTERSGKPLPMAASVYSGLAALHLSQKEFDRARAAALTGLDLGEKWLNADSQVSCYLTLAQLEQLEGRPEQAQDALDKARSMAASHQLTPGLEEQIAALEAAMHAPSLSKETGLPDPLNEHELKVLRLVAAGFSNREVGEELYLSVNTVKWHLKHTYEKLDVHSRMAAVTRAQELGLL